MHKTGHGIRIQAVNTLFVILAVIFFCLTLFISERVRQRYHAVDNAMDKYIICQQSSAQIKESSGFLTEQARLFVVTHKQEYVNAYIRELEVTRRQEQALAMLESVCSQGDLALQRLRISIEQGQSLINMELYAMRLVFEVDKSLEMPPRLEAVPVSALDKEHSPEMLRETSINNLFGDGYLIYKMRINENCDLTVSTIEQQIKDELNINADELGINLRRLRHLFLLLLAGNALFFAAYAILAIRPLGKFSAAIKQDKKLAVIGAREFRNLALAYNEIYEIKAQNERSLLKKAEYDGLTGILNRSAFDQICRNSQQKRQSIALLLVDMDNFKQVNDTYGHIGGDTALKTLAKLMTETFREGDYVARIGGDEFAIILPNFHYSAHSASIIQKKITAINSRLPEESELDRVSVSVGVAFSATGFSEKLYQEADKALYSVKEKGKCGCEFFNNLS